MSHTPGPLAVEQLPSESHSFRIYSKETGRQVALISHHPGQRPKAEAMQQEYADACLFGKAPTMFNVCKATMNYLTALAAKTNDAKTLEAAEAIRALLREIEGKEGA